MSTSGNVSLVKTRFISDDAVAELVDWPSVVGALRAAYAGVVKDEMVPPRTMARGDGGAVSLTATRLHFTNFRV